MEKTPELIEPLRVVIIGLSYSGKKLVADLLKHNYDFKILKLE
jgi:hypothetical protein